MTKTSKTNNGTAVQSASDLVRAIASYPKDWCFIPIRDNKIPCGKDWQQSRLKAEDFSKALSDTYFNKLQYQNKSTNTQKPVPIRWMKAIGVLCGTPSGGLLCFDHDGASADALIEKLSGMALDDALPDTVTVTSGKPGRYQKLYRIPEMYWGAIASTRTLTGTKTWNEHKKKGEDEQIDFRWDGEQSVLIGEHPETGSYRWVEGRSPEEIEVAEAPIWMIEQMMQDDPTPQPQPKKQSLNSTDQQWGDRQWADSYANSIDVGALDWYQWRDCLLALHHAGYSESEARSWSASSAKHTDQGFADVWNYIDDGASRPKGIGTLGQVAKAHGWASPFPKRDSDRHSEPPKEIQMDELEEESKRLVFDLQRYLKESCPRKRLILRQKICAQYRINKQDFTEQIILLERDNDLLKKRKMNGAELFQQTSEAIDFLIPRYLPRGESIMIAAEAGCGKTNIVTDALYAVLAGDNFLGEAIASPGKVLFISSDESLNTTKRRLYARGVSVLANLEDLHVWEELDITRLDELEQELEDFRPDLVIVDSVTTICSNVGINEKDPEFARYLYKLKTLLNRYNAASIILHHANKDPLAKGLGKVSGSARIPAAFWGVFLLERVENNPENPLRWLRMVKGREVSEFKVKLEIHARAEWLEKGVFSVQEDDTEHDAAYNKQQHIMQFFRSHPGTAFEFDEIQHALPYPKTTLYRSLDQLVDSKQLSQRKSKTNYKRWVWVYDPYPPLPSLGNENENLESSDSNRFRHSHGFGNENENEGMAIAKQYREEMLKPAPQSATTAPHSQSGNESGNDEKREPVSVSASHSHSHSKFKGGGGVLPGTPTPCVAIAELFLSVGDMVRCPSISGGTFQIEKLTGTHAQLSMGHIVPLAKLQSVNGGSHA